MSTKEVVVPVTQCDEFWVGHVEPDWGRVQKEIEAGLGQLESCQVMAAAAKPAVDRAGRRWHFKRLNLAYMRIADEVGRPLHDVIAAVTSAVRFRYPDAGIYDVYVQIAFELGLPIERVQEILGKQPLRKCCREPRNPEVVATLAAYAAHASTVDPDDEGWTIVAEVTDRPNSIYISKDRSPSGPHKKIKRTASIPTRPRPKDPTHHVGSGFRPKRGLQSVMASPGIPL